MAPTIPKDQSAVEMLAQLQELKMKEKAAKAELIASAGWGSGTAPSSSYWGGMSGTTVTWTPGPTVPSLFPPSTLTFPSREVEIYSLFNLFVVVENEDGFGGSSITIVYPEDGTSYFATGMTRGREGIVRVAIDFLRSHPPAMCRLLASLAL